MTTRFPRPLRAAASIALAVAILAACGGPASRHSAAAPTGEPVAGGTLTVIMANEPPQLDPAVMTNSWPTHSGQGNALYGELLTNDPGTGEIRPGTAQSLTTTDGTTWTLTLRPGVRFSDGTPLDAEAVKFNWDRMKDRRMAAASNATAAGRIVASTVIDPTTLQLTLVEPSQHFGQDIVTSALTFIASPTALRAGPEAFNANPVGAGPFVLESWVRQDRMVLRKNPTYYDAPRPYLDGLVIRVDTDQQRRLTSLQSGEVDMVIGTSDEYIARAEQELGLVVTPQPLSGATAIIFNTVKPPLDDVRARQAIVLAVDRDAVNQAAYGGAATVPTTLMSETSPFYAPDIAFAAPDRERAQQLFDELAAEGRPVELTLTGTVAAEGSRTVQAVQAQLSTFRNVRAEVETLDLAAWYAKLGGGDFEASVYGFPMVDPEPFLSRFFTTGSGSSYTKLSDPELDAALAAAANSSDTAFRRDQYRRAQERLVADVPFLAYSRPTAAMISAEDVGGIRFYGQGAPVFDGLWLDRPDS
jgi:peptide/nickel transport system substrate-binding protein